MPPHADDLRQGWKVLTHDWRSPLRGGAPICNGQLPCELPAVRLDAGPAECAAGWNYTRDIATAWRIAGCWPGGRPSRVVRVLASPDAIERGDKRRASGLRLLWEATDAEIKATFTVLSYPFGAHRSRMATEQWLWWQALARPRRDAAEIKAQLALALSARGLPWDLRPFPSARAARAARDAWAARDARDVWAAREAWDARDVWAAWDAWTARDARAAWDAWDARAAWDAWDARAAWDAWDARAAWTAWDALDARAALVTCYARLKGWQPGEPDQYTVGLREAYAAGLAVALPVGPGVLGWAMEEPS